VGLVAWAWLGEPAAARYADGHHWLEADDWRSGRELWFIEFVAPFGHARRIVDDLRGGLFRGDVARARRLRGGGLPPRQMRWHGIDVPGAA
jgi:cytolysin-activating lysine-acyltransferase